MDISKTCNRILQNGEVYGIQIMSQLKKIFLNNDANFLPELRKTEGNEAVSLSTEGKQKRTMYNSMTSKIFFKAEASDIRLTINI